jgi:hypothetical protein
MGRPNLFGANIAGAILSALGPGVLDATLVRRTAGTRPVGQVTAGLTSGETQVSYPCKGFIDEWGKFRTEASLTEENDRKILLLGASLPDDIDPRPGDLITIEARTYTIIGPVDRDPAGATFTCRGRP